MVTMILTHEVANYDAWRPFFDAGAQMRTDAGFTVTGVYRGHDNENMVTMVADVTSVEAINAFMSNPELKEGMAKGGVISAPEIKILNRTN